MSGYDLPIRDDNEREWYANVGRIQERQRIVKMLEDTKKKESRAGYQRSYLIDAIPLVIALIEGD